MSAVDGFTWTRHREHGGYWQCPNGAIKFWTAQGWEPCGAPPEVDPTTAHHERPARAPEAAPTPPAPKKAAAKPTTNDEE